MPAGTSSPKDMADRVADALSSPVLNVLVGIAGVAMPVIAWASHRAEAAGTVLAVETMLVLFLVVSHVWLRRSHALVRRPAGRGMSDPVYFDLVRGHLESDIVADFEDLADGHLTAYAADAADVVVFLLRTLTDSPVQPKLALATNLVALPEMLAAPQAREYLGENRRLIEAGGEVRRILVCWAADLVTENYARELLALVEGQRSLGVQCGLAVRDHLRPEQAVDFIVFSRAAVSVQEDRADPGRTGGRNTFHFKNVNRWRLHAAELRPTCSLRTKAALGVAGGAAGGVLAAAGDGESRDGERVVAADERGGLVGFVVVAQPHEGGRCRAADQHGGVVAQVPEQQGERDAAALARAHQGFQVVAADLVRAGDDHRRGGGCGL